MKAFVISSAFTGLASLVSAQYFELLAINSASPIMYEPVVAREEGLWLGGKTSSYCPGVVEKTGQCPKGGFPMPKTTHHCVIPVLDVDGLYVNLNPGKNTNFSGGNGGLAMGT